MHVDVWQPAFVVFFALFLGRLGTLGHQAEARIRVPRSPTKTLAFFLVKLAVVYALLLVPQFRGRESTAPPTEPPRGAVFARMGNGAVVQFRKAPPEFRDRDVQITMTHSRTGPGDDGADHPHARLPSGGLHARPHCRDAGSLGAEGMVAPVWYGADRRLRHVPPVRAVGA